MHRERHRCAEQQQSERADERQLPVAGPVDDVAERNRREDRGERRAGVHQTGRRAGVPWRDVHRDGPHRTDCQLGAEERAGKAEHDHRQVVRQEHRQHTHDGCDEADDDEVASRSLEVVRRRENAIADDAAEVVAADAGKKHQHRKDRRSFEIEFVLVHEVQRQPVQIQPKRPAVAEVHERDRGHAAHERSPRRRKLFSRDPEAVVRQRRAVGWRDPFMLGRHVAEVPEPREHPDQAAEAKRDERSAPRNDANQVRDQRRRDRIADPREGVREALREAAARGRRPALHRARRDRERRALADAEHQPHEVQRHQAAGQAGQDRRGRPDQPADKQRPPRAPLVANPAAQNLKHRVRDAEGADHLPELAVGEAEILADVASGCREVLPRDVRNEVHQAQQTEDDGRGGRALERHAGESLTYGAKVNLLIGKPGSWVIGGGGIGAAAILALAATLGAQRAPDRRLSQLVWVDRAGKKLSAITGLADFGDIELSPDRKQIAAAVLNDQTGLRELWLYDAEGKARARVDDNLADENWMIWSPDGKRVAYNSQRTRGLDLYGKDVGSKLENQLAIDEERGQWPVSWSPDGKNLLVVTNTADTGNDIGVLPLAKNAKPYPFLATAAQENWAAFSPNGKWVAFSFAERGDETELYVTTFPKPGRRYLVSARGGFQARWRRDGRELFFLATNGTLTTSHT